MSTRRKFHYFALTISPVPSPDRDLKVLEKLCISYCKKMDLIDHAWCLETGKNGVHPHCHLLVQFVKERRVDKVREQLMRYVSKFLKHPISPNLVRVGHAYNAYNWLTMYMTKESLKFHNSGFDYSLLRKLNSQDNDRMKVAILGTDLLKITRANFIFLYKQFLEEELYSEFVGFGVELDEYFTSVVRTFFDKGYQVHFFFYNKKQVINMMEFVCGQNITVDFSHQ